MTTWFTSDLHIGHKRINELARRPFTSVEEAVEAIIESWNSVVQPGDVVHVLGDLVMGDFAVGIEKTKLLLGHKVLTPGNHDRMHPVYHGKPEKKAQWTQAYRDAGWIINPLQGIGSLGNDTLVNICHFPYRGDSHGEERYKEYRPVDDGKWILHGHVHEQWQIDGNQINVGVDVWNFTPVNIDTIRDIIKNGGNVR